MANFGSLLHSDSEQNSLENRIFRLIKNEEQLKRENDSLGAAVKNYEQYVQSVQSHKELGIDLVKHIRKSHDSVVEYRNRISTLSADISRDKNEIKKYLEHVPGKKVRIIKREDYGPHKEYLVWFHDDDILWEKA